VLDNFFKVGKYPQRGEKGVITDTKRAKRKDWREVRVGVKAYKVSTNRGSQTSIAKKRKGNHSIRKGIERPGESPRSATKNQKDLRGGASTGRLQNLIRQEKKGEECVRKRT